MRAAKKKYTYVHCLHITPRHGTGSTFMLFKREADAKKSEAEFAKVDWITSVEKLVLN
jgi:hypothetical protein